jgi:seryl-tRNA synthetase
MKYHFDIKRITADPEAYDAMLASRNYDRAADKIVSLDQWRRSSLSKAQTAQSERKTVSDQIGKAIKAGATGLASNLKDRAASLKIDLELADYDAQLAERQLNEILLGLPNWPASDVPDGQDETDNVEVRRWGTAGARDGTPHYEMTQVDLGFDVAASISGARFSMLQGPVARLHRAIGQFMLDEHGKRGYREVIPPTIVNQDALYGTGQLPKFQEDLFGISNGNGASQPAQFLIPTAEVSLTNIHADQILIDGTHRYVALTDCYRAEAGSAGRDTRGLIRQHQFQKVELVTVCEPQQSPFEHDYMLNAAEQILARLDLTYRTMLLCKGDMGFSAQKTYDIEVWLPGQNTYREISSVSNCGDFQARRMNTRYKEAGQTFYAHTLNGSGLAVGRTLVAILENYQTSDDVMIPMALRPYMMNHAYLSELDV